MSTHHRTREEAPESAATGRIPGRSPHLLLAVAVLASACEREPPPAAPTPAPPPEAVVLPVAAPAPPPVNKALAYRREIARLEDLVAKAERVEARIPHLEPRVRALRRASLISTGRTVVLRALATMLADRAAGVELRWIRGRDDRWTMLVRVRRAEALQAFTAALGQRLGIAPARVEAHPSDGAYSHQLDFVYPVRAQKAAPGPPASSPPPSELTADDEKHLLRRIERLEQRVCQPKSPIRDEHIPDVEHARLSRLAASQPCRGRLELARVRMAALEQEHEALRMRHLDEKMGPARESGALVRRLEQAHLGVPRIGEGEPAAFLDVRATRHKVEAVGSPATVAGGLEALAATGVLLGDVWLNRVRREGRYRLRADVYVVSR